MGAGPVSLATLTDAVRLHPRVAYQGRFADPAERRALLDRLPALLPFRHAYHGAIVVVDWDHRLPSRAWPLRIYLYYDERSLAAGEESFDDRLEDIGRRDKFPEFDVPDFADLPADEAYDVDLGERDEVVACRLTSAWRRDVGDEEGDAAVAIARASREFAELSPLQNRRPRHLGDLEAVGWTPPCETGYDQWTLDVWYLLAFDGRIGSGRSLLVDLVKKKVVSVRDFSVRAG